MKSSKVFVHILTVLLFLIISKNALAQTKYTIVDLESLYPELSDSAYTVAYAINDKGQTVLYSYNQGNSQGYIWTPNQGLENIGTLGGDSVQPLDINNKGQIVGRAKESNGQFFPFIWDKTNGIQNIGTLESPLNNSEGHALNETGQVVGCSSTSWGPCYPFIWDSKNGMYDLGTYSAPFRPGVARGINNNGEVVGTLNNSIYYNLFIWDEVNGIQEIGSFDKDSAIPTDINDAGVVVGYNCTAPYLCSAFLWEKDLGKINLGALGTSSYSWAEAINEAGVVVGNSPYISTYGAQRFAFIWSNNTMVDLNTLIPPDSGWLLENATDINEKGQIVGWGWHNNKKKAFVLNPVIDVVEVKTWIRPRVLYAKSRGNWITSFVNLPDNFQAEEVIDETVSIIKINGKEIIPPIYAIHTHINTHQMSKFDLKVKFDRKEVVPLLQEGNNIVTIVGAFTSGNLFQGKSELLFLNKKKKHNT